MFIYCYCYFFVIGFTLFVPDLWQVVFCVRLRKRRRGLDFWSIWTILLCGEFERCSIFSWRVFLPLTYTCRFSKTALPSWKLYCFVSKCRLASKFRTIKGVCKEFFMTFFVILALFPFAKRKIFPRTQVSFTFQNIQSK